MPGIPCSVRALSHCRKYVSVRNVNVLGTRDFSRKGQFSFIYFVSFFIFYIFFHHMENIIYFRISLFVIINSFFMQQVYEKTVEDGFIVGQACIDMSAPEGARVAVIVNVREIEHTLCILTAGKLDVQRMNVCFGEGEDIAFRIEGEYDVHLTGTM